LKASFTMPHFWFMLTEINYEIHDKELLTIMDAFEEWCHVFEGAQHEITMYFYHKNLQCFMIARVLNWHQPWWALSLSSFWFMITYHSWQQQGKLDVLSCHSYLVLKEGMSLTINNVTPLSNSKTFGFKHCR
jgi:4-hydroxybenzoate polyprenyltransferase